MLTLCSKCNSPATKKCGGCQRNYYCNATCQSLHRDAHRPVCFPIVKGDHVQEPYVNAILIPTHDQPTLVTIKVAPVLTDAQKAELRSGLENPEGESAFRDVYVYTNQVYVQSEAFRVMARGNPVYERMYWRTGEPWRTPFHEQPKIPAYAMIIDSAREATDEEWDYEMFFFSGDNGPRRGIELMRGLEPNMNLSGGGFDVRGPVLLVKGRWDTLADQEYEKWAGFDQADVNLSQTLRQTIIDGIRTRYKDAGILPR